MFEIARVNDVFADFYKQLEEAKKVNEQTIFQYETPAGNKAARSHIYKLRQSKSAVEKKRKETKQDAIDFGRTLDTEAKKITSEIEEMINVHDAPLKQIEQLEKERISKIKIMIEYFKWAGIDTVTNQY